MKKLTNLIILLLFVLMGCERTFPGRVTCFTPVGVKSWNVVNYGSYRSGQILLLQNGQKIEFPPSVQCIFEHFEEPTK